MAYCLQKLGQEKEAQNIYNSILKQKPKDISVIAVASNNSVVINRDQNVFDSKKKIRSCTLEPLEFKLASRQRGALAFNQCLFALYNQQVCIFQLFSARRRNDFRSCKLPWENK